MGTAGAQDDESSPSPPPGLTGIASSCPWRARCVDRSYKDTHTCLGAVNVCAVDPDTSLTILAFPQTPRPREMLKRIRILTSIILFNYTKNRISSKLGLFAREKGPRSHPCDLMARNFYRNLCFFKPMGSTPF